MNKTSTNKITLTNMQKSFGSKVVLDQVNLDVKAGESHVIIGGSGSGKSVMLKCILGLILPTSGSIKVDGEEIADLSLAQRDHLMHKFGMLFQGGALFDSLPVWHNVAFGLLQRGLQEPEQAYETAIEKLKAVGLGEEIALLYPAELSGGMQKRVSLARAIATQPEILFFDEPTTGLDPIMADVINHLIVENVKQLGATAISITHDMASVRTIADRVSMLYQGNIIWTGAVEELENSNNDYVDQFIHGRSEGPIETVKKQA